MTDSKKSEDEKTPIKFKQPKKHGGFGQQGGGFHKGKGGGFAPRNIAQASGRKR